MLKSPMVCAMGTAVFLICIVSGVIYSNTFQAPFVFDDQHTIQENEKIRNLDNFYLLDVLRSPRPLVDYTFALNYHFGKLHVFGYHLVNLLIHIANGILVFFLSRLLFRKLSACGQRTRISCGAFRCADIYRPSPSDTGCDLYFAAICLDGRFFLSGVGFQLYHCTGRAFSRETDCCVMDFFLIAFLCGVFAFLSKQNSASLPLAILLVEYACYDRTWKGWKKKIWIILPGVLLFGLFYAYNMGLFRQDIQFARLLEDVSEITQETRKVGRWQYLCTQFNVISIYIRLLLIPVTRIWIMRIRSKAVSLTGQRRMHLFFWRGYVLPDGAAEKNTRSFLSGFCGFLLPCRLNPAFFPFRMPCLNIGCICPCSVFQLVAARACEWLFSKRRLWAYAPGDRPVFIHNAPIRATRCGEMTSRCGRMWYPKTR